MVPASLGVHPSDRHEHQTSAVELLGRAVRGVETSLEKDFENAEIVQGDVEKEKASLQEAQQAVEAQLVEKTEDVAVKVKTFEEARACFQTSKSKLDGAQAALSTARHVPDQLQGEKTAVESVSTEHLEPLVKGAPAADVRRHLASLLPVCEQTNIGFSLLAALPTAANLAPEARGQFNNMVMEELTRELREHVVALEAKLAESATTISTREQAVETITAEHATVEAAHVIADDTMKAAQADRKDCQAALQNAKTAVREIAPKLQQVAAETKAAKKALTEFRSGILRNFKVLNEHEDSATLPLEDASVADGTALAEKMEAASEDVAKVTPEVAGA
jgi:chromosome segregation ATPase